MSPRQAEHEAMATAFLTTLGAEVSPSNVQVLASGFAAAEAAGREDAARECERERAKWRQSGKRMCLSELARRIRAQEWTGL